MGPYQIKIKWPRKIAAEACTLYSIFNEILLLCRSHIGDLTSGTSTTIATKGHAELP